MRPEIAYICIDLDNLAESLCPLRTSTYQPGCSTVAVNPFEQTPMTNRITSNQSDVPDIRTGCKSAYPGVLLCPVLRRITFPVVSEWCQYRPRGRSPRLLPSPWAPAPSPATQIDPALANAYHVLGRRSTRAGQSAAGDLANLCVLWR